MITNYSELQTAIASYLDRSDLTSMIPTFISLAEAKLNRSLRLRAQESTAAGTASASVALPSDFLQVISITVTCGGSTYPVDYIRPGDVKGESRPVYHYTIVGSNIVFDPVAADTTYMLTYYAKFQTVASYDNWLITNAPDVYLYASLLECEPYLKNDDRMMVWNSLLQRSIDDLVTQDNYARYGQGLRMRAK
jgi:hypothetical protein